MSDIEEADFNGIIASSYCVDERQLLRREADALYGILPNAQRWVRHYLPDYIMEQPFIEFVDLFGFGIEAWIEIKLADAHLMHLTELTEGETDV